MSTGYCYAAETASLYKFGWSDDPYNRVFHLSGEVGETVSLIGYAKGGRVQEAVLHELLRPHRAHGEWYFKNPVTARAAALFPPKKATNKTRRDALQLIRGDKELAHEILRSCLEPGRSLASQFKAIGDETGLGSRRLRAIWHKEARVVTPLDLGALRSAARARALFDRDGEA